MPEETLVPAHLREHAAMLRAVALGTHGLGTTNPNPSVGCVILDAHGEQVGQGASAPAGGPHAEVNALRQAGPRARGGTAVVTLEPCDHTGRTGPCTEALLGAGIARVVYAQADPDPVAAGGAASLMGAGVDVEQLADGDEVAAYLWPWLLATRLGRPAVTWKSAASLDGRTAAPDGTSRWITGPQARAEVHELRGRVDAVLVGSETVITDDPALTDRREGVVRQPLRVVADRRNRIPAGAAVLDGNTPTHVSRAETPGALLAELHALGVRHVLLEGGATLAGAFLAAGLIDETISYLAPLLIGAGAPVLSGATTTLADATALAITDVRVVGRDVRITSRLSERSSTTTTSSTTSSTTTSSTVSREA